MMRKLFTVASMLCIATATFAYNPPISGETLDRLVSPTQLTYGSSSAGGGIFTAAPDAIVWNPALVAFEQRITIDAAYTALISTKSEQRFFGSAFQGGITIPSKWFIASAVLKGTFLPMSDMHVGNTITTNAAIAKEVSERISVGLGLNGGVFFGAGSDWQLGANLGVVYRLPVLGFMKDFRVGASVLNLGKNFTSTTLEGINREKAVGMFPMIGTVHAGVAALMFSTDIVKGGLSLEVYTPCFQNFLTAASFHFSVNDALYIRIAEEFNLREAITGHPSYIPAISIGYSFSFKTKNNNYFKENDWGQSEMAINAAWQQLYGSVHAASANVKLTLGMQDTEPPKIEILFDEEDEQ
ncbi:MAG: hypothetical protein J6I73_07015 [Treponema sp.]|nr:hypothetical protein [Treponema sp.]